MNSAVNRWPKLDDAMRYNIGSITLKHMKTHLTQDDVYAMLWGPKYVGATFTWTPSSKLKRPPDACYVKPPETKTSTCLITLSCYKYYRKILEFPCT